MEKAKSVSDYIKEECIVWLRNFGLSTSGKEEMQEIVLKQFQRCRSLVSKSYSNVYYMKCSPC